MPGWTTPPANGQHLAVHIGRLHRNSRWKRMTAAAHDVEGWGMAERVIH